jgi:uncharacterized UPF0160 family protein
MLLIGIHPGPFREDSIVAVALFCLLHPEKFVRVMRSRNKEDLSMCDIVVDVDDYFMQFDDINRRDNNVPYSSAGLFWKLYGIDIIKLYSSELDNYEISDDEISMIFDSVDEKVIQEIDKINNGLTSNHTPLGFIASFALSWNDNDLSKYYTCFEEALNVTKSILRQLIVCQIRGICGSYYVLHKYFENPSTRILEIPSETFPWLYPIISLNESHEAQIDFVIFKYPSGGYAAQCVPPSIKERFSQRVSFPKEWAGLMTTLPEVSGINDATFCHNGRFFARAVSKESIIKMCNTAIERNG